VVEAIELDGAPVLGVQWELQEEWRIDARFARVFDWFVDAAVHSRAGSPLLRPPAVCLS
jgi:gamma-glutamyl-gamma-aminobutyrate hydrolase PuuD